MVTRFKHWFYLKNCLFGSAKLTKNADADKYKYSSNSRLYFSLPDNTIQRNVIIFRANMDSSVHIDNKEKDILIFGEVPTQRLEAKYSVNFTELNRKFCLGLHYNGSNSFLFANATKI